MRERERIFLKESDPVLCYIPPKKKIFFLQLFFHYISPHFMSAVSTVWKTCFQDHSPSPLGGEILGGNTNTTMIFFFWFESGTFLPGVFIFKFSEFLLYRGILYTISSPKSHIRGTKIRGLAPRKLTHNLRKDHGGLFFGKFNRPPPQKNEKQCFFFAVPFGLWGGGGTST